MKDEKKEIEENLNKLEVVEAFLLGVEVTGKDDVYQIRQKIFDVKGYFIRRL